MGRPRSNELARSGHTALGEHARADNAGVPQAQDDGPVGPVLPGNQPGHRRADDSDTPVEALAVRFPVPDADPDPDSPSPGGPGPDEVVPSAGGQPSATASQVTGMHPPTSIQSGGWWPARDRVNPRASNAEGVRIDLHHDRTPPLVRVSGELDITAVPLLVALLDHARRRHPFVRRGLQQRTPPDRPVDVDLSHVTFADSHGLAPILNGAATVVSASTCVRRLLELLQQLQPPGRADREPASPRSSAPRRIGVEPRTPWQRDPA